MRLFGSLFVIASFCARSGQQYKSSRQRVTRGRIIKTCRDTCASVRLDRRVEGYQDSLQGERNHDLKSARTISKTVASIPLQCSIRKGGWQQKAFRHSRLAVLLARARGMAKSGAFSLRPSLRSYNSVRLNING